MIAAWNILLGKVHVAGFLLGLALAVVFSQSRVALAGGDDSLVDPVRAGKNVLERDPKYPWYDADGDSVKPPSSLLKPRTNPTNQQKRSSSSPFGGSPGASSGMFGGVAQLLMMLVLATFLVGLIYAMVVAYLNRENELADQGAAAAGRADRTEADRVESLPFPVRRVERTLLDDARKHYEAGNYREAIIFLYSHLLVSLDRAQLIRLERGKTNRQYLGEVSPHRALRGALEPTMVAFEDVFFGNHDLPRKQFEDCWRQCPEMERVLSALTP